MRPARFLALAVFLSACSSGPELPTEADYSHGASALVASLEPLFALDAPLSPERLAAEEAAGPLEELARRFTAATAPPSREVRLRIVDLRLEGSRALTLDLEARLTGLAPGTGERVAALASWRCALTRTSEGAAWRLAGARPLTGRPALQKGFPHLVEEAVARGLTGSHQPFDPIESTNRCIPATHHRPGVLLADVNGDGAVDVILPSSRTLLFLNDGSGRFHDATEGSGLDALPAMESSGGAAADLDGDGLPELFLTCHAGQSRMLKNLGGGRFRDVTREWGLEALTIPATAAVFLDADRDGRVDLFVVAYGDARLTGPSYSGFNGMPDRFFHDVGRDGHPFFVDETLSSGLADAGWGLAASACDLDDDGDDDLYIANDFGMNGLYENVSTPGHVRFRDITKGSGAEDDGFGMGVTWGDFDGDGRWDLYVADFWTPYRWVLRDPRWPMPHLPLAWIARPIVSRKMVRRSRGNGLFRGDGHGRFTRVSESAGVADGGWCWGVEFVDLDGKGREDLVAVNGMFEAGMGGTDDEIGFWNEMGHEGVSFHDGEWRIDFGRNGMASRTPKRLWWNRGDGTFEERTFVEGFDTLADARGLAYADLDGDGAPDVVVSTFRGPLLLYANRWRENGRLSIRLDGRGTNRSAIGAVVRITAGGRTQLREVRAGSSYLSQSSQELLVGLGRWGAAERVEVRWPDGTREETHDVPAGTRLLWSEGAPPRTEPLARPVS